MSHRNVKKIYIPFQSNFSHPNECVEAVNKYPQERNFRFILNPTFMLAIVQM